MACGRVCFAGCLQLAWMVLVAGLLTGGCGSKASRGTEPSPSDASAVKPTGTAERQQEARIAQAVAMRAGVEPPPPKMALRGGEPATAEVLEAYNQQLTRLIFRRKDAPETLEELVTKWPMPRLPVPPPGKRIVYDEVNRIIRLDPP